MFLNQTPKSRVHRKLPAFTRNHITEEEKFESKIKAKLTRAIKVGSVDDIQEILAASNHLHTHAIEKAIGRGKVNIVEMLLPNIIESFDVRFALKLFTIAMKNNKVECFDIIQQYCDKLNLRFHPRQKSNFQRVFTYGCEKFYPEMINWALRLCEKTRGVADVNDVDNTNNIFICYFPEKIENWGVLQWLKERRFPCKFTQKQIDNFCKYAFEKRNVGTLLWLKSHGYKISQDADLLLFVNHVSLEPLKELVGPDVHSVILKYLR